MPIKLSKALYDKITKISKELDMPRTQVINMMVNEWIKKNAAN